jgi:glycosyltransferase involved in cell wall biosynthesis
MMNVKKILLMGPFPPPMGGDSVSTYRLYHSNYWKEAGIEVEHIDTSHHRGIRLQHEKPGFRDIFRAIRIFTLMLLRLPRADVLLLWVNSRFICTAGVAVILFSSLMSKPVVVKFFGGHLAQRINSYPAPWKRFVISVLDRAEFLLPQTSMLEKEFVDEIGLTEDKMVLFPNFVPDSFIGDEPEWRSFSGRCIFVGQIKRDKGVFEIMDALGDRDNVTCDFYGDLYVRDREDFESRISRLSNCHYRGVVGPGKICDVIRGYDVLLLPTRHVGEAYPAVIIEAFAAGVAVVAARWKSIPDLVEDKVRGILIDPYSADDIVAAIDNLQSDDELFNTIRMNSHSYVKSFSEKSIVRDLLIDKILEGI